MGRSDGQLTVKRTGNTCRPCRCLLPYTLNYSCNYARCPPSIDFHMGHGDGGGGGDGGGDGGVGFLLPRIPLRLAAAPRGLCRSGASLAISCISE